MVQQIFRSLLQKYGDAWEQQDTALVLSIFTENATFHDAFYENPIQGTEAIKNYWNSKVCAEQANIKFTILHCVVNGNTAIAEWEVEFDDLVNGVRKHLKQVGVFELEGGKLKSLREYYKSKVLHKL